MFEHPHPLLTMGYLLVLVFFTIYLVLSRNKRLNPRFRVIVSISVITSYSIHYTKLYDHNSQHHQQKHIHKQKRT